MSKNRPRPQNTTADSDLFNVTPKRNEMHQLMQQLDLPNESLTLSSLSQSPFNVNARREFGKTKAGAYNDKNSDSNSDVMGRSDYQSKLFQGAGNAENSRQNNKNMLAYTTDEQLQDGEDDDDDGVGGGGGTYDYQQDPSPRFDDLTEEGGYDYSDYTNKRRQGGLERRASGNGMDYSKADKSAHQHIDTADEDEINDYYHSKSSCRDISPDFTGHSNNEDLTVSQNNVSQMRLDNQNGKIGGAQNRTFADSVINHRLLTEPASQNKTNAMKQFHKHKINETTGALSNNDVYQGHYDDDECINERDEESKEEVDESASDISGLNSFTQTQYSKHSKMGGRGNGNRQGMQFKQIKAPDVDLTEDNMVTKRSPNIGSRYQNMDHDSSLELTPESLSSKYLLSTSKSAKHNTSINRDHELESALVEGGGKHMVRTGSVDQMASHKQKNSDHQSNEFQTLRQKLSLLNIENQKQKTEMNEMRQLIDEKEHQIFNQSSQVQSVQHEFENCRNHLDLLKVKTKDDSKLNALRGKQLTTAVKNYQQAQKVIQQKDYDIQQLFNQLHEKNGGQKAYEMVVNQELKKLTTEIDSLRIINERLKKDKVEQGENETSLQKKFKLDFEKAQQQNVYQLKQIEGELKKFQSLVAEKDEQLQKCYSDLKELDSIVEQREKIIENECNEKQRLQVELKKVKERCDDQEKELNQFKQYDNSTLFGNSINMGHGVNNLNQTSKQTNDLEIRQMKEVFQQKLTKAQADSTKWKNSCKDLETKIAKLEEEGKKRLMESRSQQSSKIEQDQELLKEIRRLQQHYEAYLELQNDIRLCFELSENDDIMGKLQELKNVQEENILLQEDKQLIAEQYEVVKKEFQEALVKINSQQATKQVSSDNMSQFTKNLLLQKDKEIEKSKDQIKVLNEKLSEITFQNDELRNECQSLQTELKTLQEQLELAQTNNEKTNDAKQKAEKNVESLKDQLRSLMRAKEEETPIQLNKDKQSQQANEEMKRKYQQLIEQVLQLDLAPDPLQQVNFSLQNSFIDEYEQASQHLNDQEKLVKELIKQLKTSQEMIANNNQELEAQLEQKQQKLDDYEKQTNSLTDQLHKKDLQLNVVQLEHETVVSQYQKLQDALSTIESANAKLKNENDSLNNDLRKLRRSQEHLYKGPKKSGYEKATDLNQSSKQTQEVEKLIAEYEDKVSNLDKQVEILQAELNSSKKSQEQQEKNDKFVSKEGYRIEFLSALDQLIDSGKKLTDLNDLQLQLLQRIQKIRSQEKLKLSSQGGQTQKQSKNQGKEQHLQSSLLSNNSNVKEVEADANDDANNDDQDPEFVLSVAKWLKQSQGGAGHKKLQNFFKGEDNSSMLLINDLIPQQNVQQQEQQLQEDKNNLTYHMQSDLEVEGLKSEILALKQSIEEKEANVIELQESLESAHIQFQQKLKETNAVNSRNEEQYKTDLVDLGQKIQHYEQIIKDDQAKSQSLSEKIAQKELLVQQLQEQLQQKQSSFDASQKQNKQHLELEIEHLKETIRQDFNEKTQKLDSEYEELEKSRLRMKEDFEKQNREVEQKYKKRIEEQEKEFREKLLQMEKDVKSGCEKNKDEVVGNIYKEMEEQYNNKVKQLKEEHHTTVQQIKQENQKQLDEAKRVKDRELKRQREEAERAKKSFEERIKKLQQDVISERESCELDYKSKLDELVQKGKKDVKTAQDKVRAEMRNQIDNVKNDCIKQKADWERDRKKQFNDYQQQVEQNTRELEEQFEQQLKTQKDQADKTFKKKMEDKEQGYREKLDEYEVEIQQINNAHKEESKRDKDRLEMRMRETIRAEVGAEIREELEGEFSEELEKIQYKFQKDLDLIRQKYEQVLEEERNSNQVVQQKVTRNAETQCTLSNTGYHSERTHQSVNQSISSNTMQHAGNTIDRVEYGYRKDLERQQQVFELQLVQKQQITVRIFEELLNLECKKIMDSIHYKSGPSANTKVLDSKRKEVNTLINDILLRNDDRQEKQMKISLDNIKVKICEVLRLYKDSLEAKMAKNQTLMLPQKQNLNQIRHSINGAIELPHNISKVSMSNVEYKSEYGESDIQSLAPTPKNKNVPKDERSIQIKKEFEQYLNEQSSGQKHKHSDVKRYIEYNEEVDNVNPENVLKKVTPLPNQRGVMMVEVDKVVRDVKMLQQTIKQSKFYRVLMPIGDQLDQDSDSNQNSDKQETNHEATVQAYRQLLNDLMKIIVKLNKGVDQISKQQEVYKLKLLNGELRDQLMKIKNEQINLKKQTDAEEVLSYYSIRMNILTENGQECLNRLEQTQFQINKLQFSLYQICDLFTIHDENKGTETINSNAYEVAQKCKDYVQQYPMEDLNENNKLLSSQYSPEQKKISPEMLSPEETAQLVASVFQKLNSAHINNNVFETTALSNNNNNNHHNTQLDTYQSFFNTFLSNDDYKRSAENFIKQFNECSKLNQTSQKSGIPIQRSMDNLGASRLQQSSAINNHVASNQRYQTDIPLQMKDKKRSNSYTMQSNNSCNLPPQYVSNVFHSNMLDNNRSIQSHQPVPLYGDTQSQASFFKSHQQQLPDHQYSNINMSSVQPTNQNFYQQNQNSAAQFLTNASLGSIQGGRPTHDSVSSAQQNVNSLFNQLKLNLNVPQMQQDSFH